MLLIDLSACSRQPMRSENGSDWSVCVQPTANEKALAVESLVSSVSAAGAGSRDLHQQTRAKYQRNVRDELLGGGGEQGRS